MSSDGSFISTTVIDGESLTSAIRRREEHRRSHDIAVVRVLRELIIWNLRPTNGRSRITNVEGSHVILSIAAVIARAASRTEVPRGNLISISNPGEPRSADIVLV
jgi:hypothetical protein